MTNHLAALKEHIASYYTTDAREEIAWAVAEIEHLTRERDEWAGVAAERNREIANLRSDIAQLRGELSLAEEGLANFAQSAGEPRADGIAAELRQLADTNEADGAGDMIGFTPNALRAIADRIDGAPVKSKGDPT